MKILYIIFSLALVISIYSCSDNSSSNTETKDSYSAITFNDTTTISFEIVGLKINDTRSKSVNYASSSHITRMNFSSVSSGSVTVNVYQDTILRSTMTLNSVKDTVATFYGRPTKIDFVPTNFTGKGTIEVRGTN
ncbi:MAG: hypothetical protein PHN88_12055 [Ignavibacteria bacterium]|nr:hypothetical protein [Ignavibacteria bacterium]